MNDSSELTARTKNLRKYIFSELDKVTSLKLVHAWYAKSKGKRINGILDSFCEYSFSDIPFRGEIQPFRSFFFKNIFIWKYNAYLIANDQSEQ